MAQNTLKTRIKHACKTESEWSSSNPILLLGELAFSPGGKYKIGDGTSKWSELSYVIPTKADIGLGNVENKSSATIRGELTKANVTTALGYTPPTTNTTYGVATSSTLGLVKSGTDITVDSSGNVSVNDDSHNHVISNVDGLQTALDGKASTSHTHTVVNGVTPEWSGSIAWADTAWIAAWTSDGAKIKALAKSSFAPASHTHSYAGSASTGGSATSAVKLDTATAGTVARPVYFTGGKPVQIDYTIEKSVPSNAVFTDTKNTSGSTDTSSKIYLIGATSQATNPQTYSDNQVYALNGLLNGNKVSVSEKVTLEYNSDTSCLNFVFA